MIIRIALISLFGIIALIYNIKHKDPLKVFKPEFSWKDDILGRLLCVFLYIWGIIAIWFPIVSIFEYAPHEAKILRIISFSVWLTSFVLLKIFFSDRFEHKSS